jgi:type II secretory pathway pseudopilin PulG
MNSPKNHRRGFTLLEVIALLPLMTAILVLSVALAPVVLKNVPADGRATQTNRQLIGMLQRIEHDMDAGIALPDVPSKAESQPNEQALLIQTTSGLVCYKFEDNLVTRSLPAMAESPAQAWQLRDASVSWKKVAQAGQADGIEIRTAAIGHAEGKDVEHLVNTHVYFLNALQSQLVQK